MARQHLLLLLAAAAVAAGEDPALGFDWLVCTTIISGAGTDNSQLDSN